MKIVIASSRPLPIRYDQQFNIYYNRGIDAPASISLPFFVEITPTFDGQSIEAYINDLLSQYKKYELELYIEHEKWHQEVKRIFPFAKKHNNIFKIIK